MSVGAIYHAGVINAGINQTIENSTTIKPLNPNDEITQNGKLFRRSTKIRVVI